MYTLKYLSQQSQHINIAGVNTLEMDPKYLEEVKTVEYIQVQIEFHSIKPEEESGLLHELRETGFVVDVELVPSEDSHGIKISTNFRLLF